MLTVSHELKCFVGLGPECSALCRLENWISPFRDTISLGSGYSYTFRAVWAFHNGSHGSRVFQALQGTLQAVLEIQKQRQKRLSVKHLPMAS